MQTVFTFHAITLPDYLLCFSIKILCLDIENHCQLIAGCYN